MSDDTVAHGTYKGVPIIVSDNIPTKDHAPLYSFDTSSIEMRTLVPDTFVEVAEKPKITIINGMKLGGRSIKPKFNFWEVYEAATMPTQIWEVTSGA